MKRIICAVLGVLLITVSASAQVCVDITERMNDGNAAQREAITARVKQLRDQGRDVYVTAKSTYSTIHAVCKPVPPPGPVDCQVSTWTCAAPVWGACVAGTQTGTQQCTRTVITQPANGGAACPALNEVRTVTQACTVTPPPTQCADGIDNDKDGLVDVNDPGCSGASDNDETNPTTPPSGDVVILDDAEYDMPRTGGTDAPFRAKGWNGAKTTGLGGNGAGGYIYTVTTIPGFTGTFPGGGSRVLALEARPTTSGGQTDFYLQLGNENTPDKIPSDVWIQFWVYPQDHAASGQASLHWNRNKFLYFARQTYPSHDHQYMVNATATSSNPLNLGHTIPSPGFYITTSSADGGTTLNYTGPGADPHTANIIGPQTTDGYIPPNRWTLIKMHYTPAGSWEMWTRTTTTPFVKVADWRNGVGGLTWTVPNTSGHRMMRMPTTVGHASGDPTQAFDYWLYMDDFMITRTEASLRVY